VWLGGVLNGGIKIKKDKGLTYERYKMSEGKIQSSG
jgi:hypothetical protein